MSFIYFLLYLHIPIILAVNFVVGLLRGGGNALFVPFLLKCRFRVDTIKAV